MRTTDQQLVDLVRDVPANALSREQIERLWQRFVESDALRDELIGKEPGPDYLRQAFERLDLPVDAYLCDPPTTDPPPHGSESPESAVSRPARRKDPLILVHMSWLPVLPVALFACVLLAALTIVPLLSALRSRPSDSRPAAAERPETPGDEGTAAVSPQTIDGSGNAAATANHPPPEPATDTSRLPASDAHGPDRHDLPQPADIPRGDVEVEPDRAPETDAPQAPPGVDETKLAESAADDLHTPAFPVDQDDAHPLLIDFDKESYNVWAELDAALDADAGNDALRVMRMTPPGTRTGLLPDFADADLFLPFDALIASAVRDRPVLLDEMRRQFGPVARVRLTAALADDDMAGVAAVAAQYYGTEAAVGAHQWLGDRALSGGDFRTAAGHYQQALHFDFEQFTSDLNARLRLAGAMQGLDLGHPVAGLVTLGDTHMPATEFEAMVAEQAERHSEAATLPATPLAGTSPENELPPAPLPAPYELRRWSAMPVGSRGWVQFDDDDPRLPSDPDWPAWCLSAAPAGRDVILSNRLQVSALRLATGEPRWQQSFDDARGYPATWSWVPMPPLVMDKRIYLRRLPRATGPELVCLDRDTGRVLWDARPGDHVASKPCWLRGTLVALTADSTRPTSPSVPRRRSADAKDRVFHLHLTTFQPTSGEVLTRKPLVRLRDPGCGVLSCRAVAVGDDLVVTAGGIALRTDADGETRWLRRQPYVTTDDGLPHHGYHGPPLVLRDRVFIYQPGATAIECLDFETGRRIWRSELADVTRVVGLVSDRLIVQARTALVAFAADDGQMAWRHAAEGLTQAYLCGGPGGLAYVDRATEASGDWQLDLVWIDAIGGGEVQRHRLAEFSHGSRRSSVPQCGPFFQVDQRLLLGISREYPKPVERELYELVSRSD